MFAEFSKGRYRVRPASGAPDLETIFALRNKAFAGTGPGVQDRDRFDGLCTHVLIEDRESGQGVGCFRALALRDGSEIEQSYSAQFYGLTRLGAYPAPMLELGRFCVDAERRDPDILRAAWAALTRYVDAHQVGLLFGCSSFRGVRGDIYAEAFEVLRNRHLAPARWSPDMRAGEVFRFAGGVRCDDMRRALHILPPLLRTYLLMGGWVSDHAVIDRQLGTLHVFTGVEIAAIPETRQRLLRSLAGPPGGGA